MKTEELIKILDETTKVYRKGPLVEAKREAGVEIIEVFGYPDTKDAQKGEDFEKVDMLFIDVLVNKKRALEFKSALEEILADYPDPERLEGGPSYMELAPKLDLQQEGALRLMALGSALKMWEIIDVRKLFPNLELGEEHALEMAGRGFLNISGWKKSPLKTGKVKH